MTTLTDAEVAIVDKLAEAWNAFMLLPVEHQMDQREFCSAIHACQDMILSRPGRRQLVILKQSHSGISPFSQNGT